MRSLVATGILLGSCVLTFAAPGNGQMADEAFRAGQAAAQSGDHVQAVRYYRTALTVVDAPRIRLELAYSLLRSGQYVEAHRLFRETYSDTATPLAVRRNILPLMEEAELRTMRVRFGARITTDSNPAKVGQGASIFFNGVPMTYEPAQKKEVAYGVEPYLTVERLWDNGYLSSLSLGARLFEDSELNAGLFSVALGKRFDALGGINLQARLDGEWREDDSYVMPSIDGWKRFDLSRNARVGFGAQVGYMISENPDTSGEYYRPYVFGDVTVLPNAVAFARASVEFLDTRNEYYAYTSPRLDIGINLKLADWDLTPQVGIWSRQYSQFDEWWGVTRKDVTVRPSISISNESFEFHGIRPELNLFYEERDSNIDMNSYDQFGGFVNIRRAY